MATLVEVTQSVPKVQDVTLKLSRSEAADLKIYIEEYYKRNYSGNNIAYYRDNCSTYVAVKKALDGKAEPSVVKAVPAYAF